MGILADANPTRLSKQSQAVPLQASHIGLSTVLPSRSALEDGSELSSIITIQAMSYHSHQWSYLKKSYDQIWTIITDG